MEPLTAAILCIAIMLIMLNLGLPIAYSVGFSSAIVGLLTYGTAALEKLGWTTFQTVFNPAWTPLPLFAFMGCLVAKTRMGEDLFRTARLWFSRLPGALVVSTIFAQAGIAATLGASAAAILAIGPVAIPELTRYSYDRKMSLGAITCGGVLGPLIPPSATAVIIAGLANLSLGPLLVAGVVPGILLASLLSLVPVLKCARNPSLGPSPGAVSWKERLHAARRIWPIIFTFLAIFGSIFFGVTTVTEAGGVGALIVLLISCLLYKVGPRQIYEALIETAKINAQLLFIIVGASFFSYIVGSSVLARQLAEFVAQAGLHPILVVLFIQLILLILGCFIDGMTIMMITVPIFVPLVTSMGLNPIWFAILFEVNMEISLITPPMGINFFLVRSVFSIPSGELLRGVIPYLAVLVLFLFLLIAFPQITLWLPGLMTGG
jgi:tripartite ATP-independent transporter DctM subunit